MDFVDLDYYLYFLPAVFVFAMWVFLGKRKPQIIILLPLGLLAFLTSPFRVGPYSLSWSLSLLLIISKIIGTEIQSNTNHMCTHNTTNHLSIYTPSNSTNILIRSEGGK